MKDVFSSIFPSRALPIMYTIVVDLRLFANNAELQLSRSGKGKPGEVLEKAADTIMACFRVCAADNRAAVQDSKKWGMLYLINQLFKIYFKINKMHLCKPLIRAIESSNLKDKFSISQLVTYRYYVGRKAMFDSDFKNAETYLSFAFVRCHKSCKQNKRLILMYLLPVKMLLATSEGNLRLLERTMAEHEGFFIKSGVYLILEKLKTITYRNLIKKVFLMMNSHIIPIDAIMAALKFMGQEEVDSDEVQCIIANLIYK
ncbi:putative PCI domain-containing protein 2-like, partial [Apostichopus japonicus]